MRKLLAIGATLVFAIALSSIAPARGAADEAAVGSAKTDTVIFLGSEHASFSAHNIDGPSCEAKGQIVYESDLTGKLTANIVELNVVGNRAFFGGPITKTSEPFLAGRSVFFDATDSGLPGGTGDTFSFEIEFTPAEPPGVIHCLTPSLNGHPITSGNIVIKGGLP